MSCIGEVRSIKFEIRSSLQVRLHAGSELRKSHARVQHRCSLMPKKPKAEILTCLKVYNGVALALFFPNAKIVGRLG